MTDSFGVLWMIVPEPNPVVPWLWTLIRTTVSHGFGLTVGGAGRSSRSSSSSRSASSGASSAGSSRTAAGASAAGGGPAFALAAR